MYFKSFPYTLYSLDNTSTIQVVTNITTRVTLSDEVKNNLALFDEYDVRDGDTPELVADRFYKNSELHWLVLHYNEIIDPRFDWPLDTNNLNRHVTGKYANVNAVHHYEDANGNYVNGRVILLSLGAVSPITIAFSDNYIKKENNIFSQYYISHSTTGWDSFVSSTAVIGREVYATIRDGSGFNPGPRLYYGVITSVDSTTQNTVDGSAKFTVSNPLGYADFYNFANFDTRGTLIDIVEPTPPAPETGNAFINFNVGDVFTNNTNIGTGYITTKNSNSNVIVTLTTGGVTSGDQIKLVSNVAITANITSTVVLSGTPVTNLVYEDEVNESKRRIKILKASYVDAVVNDFKKKLSE